LTEAVTLGQVSAPDETALGERAGHGPRGGRGERAGRGDRTTAANQAEHPPQVVDQRLLDATVRVLAAYGWDGLSLDRVADAAGLSRVTVWRQGATKETLVAALLDELATDFRASMWPVLTAPGSGRDRLEAGLRALCEVADRHLPLLLASDHVFHRGFQQAATGTAVNFTEPFARFAAEGLADGTLYPLCDDPWELGEVAFNTACWSYVHLRGRHEWSSGVARDRVLAVVVRGLSAGA
jgi:AcrR family transcriptional regulator